MIITLIVTVIITITQIQREMLMKNGIDIGKTHIAVHVLKVTGIIKHLDGSIHKRFATTSTAHSDNNNDSESDSINNNNGEEVYPLQATLRTLPNDTTKPKPKPKKNKNKKNTTPESDDNDNNNESESESTNKYEKAAQVLIHEFPPGSIAILLSRLYFGCIATIHSIQGSKLTLTLALPSPSPSPSQSQSRSSHHHNNNNNNNINGTHSVFSHRQQYCKHVCTAITPRWMKSGEVSRKLGLSPRALGQITSR